MNLTNHDHLSLRSPSFKHAQYSLLQKVVEACKEQKLCRIRTSPEALGLKDHCPAVSKYAEIAYKCRPSEYFFII